jgi:tetratricopeptide (TPR) repeat protein
MHPESIASYSERLALAMLLTIALASSASAQGGVDRIRRQNGVDSGKITAITPLGVTITKGAVESTIPSEDVESITFAGEPSDLAAARNAILAGRAQDALDALAKLPADGSRREEIAADIEFYTALAKAQLALAGGGKPDAAITEVRGFMARRNKSFHIPQSIELLGDLLAASGQYAGARTEYAKLAKARSPYFELKSALLLGRAWQAEGDHAKALAEFDKVLASIEQSPRIEPIRLAATLDRAVSQAAGGKVDESTAAIGEIIAKADPEDAELQARAYNALGDCYLKSGDPRGALFAFLHVDLLFHQEAEAHAKALHELVNLWKTAGHDTRSQEAAQQLAEKYPNSRWAKP